jgi:hypothetical protein
MAHPANSSNLDHSRHPANYSARCARRPPQTSSPSVPYHAVPNPLWSAAALPRFPKIQHLNIFQARSAPRQSPRAPIFLGALCGKSLSDTPQQNGPLLLAFQANHQPALGRHPEEQRDDGSPSCLDLNRRNTVCVLFPKRPRCYHASLSSEITPPWRQRGRHPCNKPFPTSSPTHKKRLSVF